MLHRDQALVPTAAEVKKLDALNAVLIYHERAYQKMNRPRLRARHRPFHRAA